MDAPATSNVSRRRFLAGAAGLTTAAVVAGIDPALRRAALAAPADVGAADPFTLGVASGDPDHRSVVLWTRLAPAPLDPGALPPKPVPVVWEVFADEGLRRRVASGVELARPEWAHSVHVEVGGLAPDRWYWYRFRTTGARAHESPVGRTRTFPAPGRRADSLRFALASCQMWEHGHFTAYRHMADDDLDVVVHAGDYLYEYGPGEYTVPSGTVRTHDGPEIVDLTSYRNRHALYRTDPDLQAAHAAFPFVVTWDDHEFENNYADWVSEDADDPEAAPTTPEFLQRRANAYRAYWEHLPLRNRNRPFGNDMRLYRRLAFGDLASISVLDTRQYRSDQACGDRAQEVPCGDWEDPRRTMTGGRQALWLADGMVRSRATWNVVAQQVFFAQRDFLVGEGQRLSMDGWDGYPAARRRLVDLVQRRGVDNLVVLTGDVHRHYAADIKADFADPASPTVGSELVCTSITSGGDGDDERQDELRAESPHVRYSRNRRGYVRCVVDARTWRADYLTLPYVSRPGAPIAVDASFVLEAGRPGLQPA